MKKNQSSAAIMWRQLMTMITVLTLALTVVILIAVSHQILKQTQSESDHIIASLKSAVIDGDDDWENWRKTSTLDTSTSYVYVRNSRSDAKVKHYYSPNADDLLSIDPIEIPINKHLYYRPHFGLLFRRTGHARGIYYTLWLSMDNSVKILLRVVEATVMLLVITLFLAPFYIRRLTHRLTDPLTTLSTSTKKLASGFGADLLPVPKTPTEVGELATDFNHLLTELHERQEQQKTFILNAAHELRTPIATIRSHSQLIERRGKEHPEVIPKSVAYITQESRQMEQLVEELLALTRADRLTVDLHPVDLTKLMQELTAKLQNTLPQSLAVTIAEGVQVNADESALEQIIDNLVGNASKYSPKDAPIAVTLTTDASQAVITVADSGSGISAEDKPHVFERFYRSAEVRGTVTGTGLGLAIAAQLAERFKGEFEISDNEPTGTIIRLAIPLLS